MEQYHDLLKRVVGKGDVQFEPRTQEYILGVSTAQSIYDLREGFPLMTTKNVTPRWPFEELFWKLRGERNVKSLTDKGIDIWDRNAFDHYLKRKGLREKIPKHSAIWNEEFARYQERLRTDEEFARDAGDLGPVYGFQWRHWRKPVFVPGHAGATDWIPDEWRIEEVDQLKNVLENIKKNPGSRYHILSSWNSGVLPEMAIGPCPFWHQFTTYKNGSMDLTEVQRSCDVFLGVPFNIAQDSLLAHMVAKETGFNPRFFNHQYINVHAYLGVPPRADFWTVPENVREFQRKFNSTVEREDYLSLRKWYVDAASPEAKEQERKDHIPFILEQLSKEPRALPEIRIADMPLLEMIERPVEDVVKVSCYNPEKWDSRAAMAV